MEYFSYAMLFVVLLIAFSIPFVTSPYARKTILVLLRRGETERAPVTTKTDYLAWFLAALLVALVAAFVISVPFRKNAEYQAIVTIWAGLGTTALAVLTASYVWTTSRQLGAMRSQLSEMQKTREMMGKQLTEMETSRYLLVQPLPYVSELRCAVGAPALLHPSADGELNLKPHIFLSIEGDLKNLGNGPALQMDTYVELVYRGESSGDVAKRAAPMRTSFLQSTEDVSVSEFFSEVEASDLLDNVLSNRSQEAPRARVVSLYRNATGGCFRATYEFALNFYREDKEKLSEWASVVRTVPTRYSNEIAGYEAQKSLGKARREKAWNALREAFAADVGEDAGLVWLDIAATPLARRTKLEMLSEVSYVEALDSTAEDYASVIWLVKPKKAAEAKQGDPEGLPFE
jgi:branched-subunit amino acid transport protein